MGKWDEFKNERYHIEDKGREFYFLIPSCKLKKTVREKTIEEIVRTFVKKHVGAITHCSVSYSGEYKGRRRKSAYDESRPYFVSFLSKERIPIFLEFLAAIAKEIGEECIYVGAGQHRATVGPTDKTRSLKKLVAQS